MSSPAIKREDLVRFKTTAQGVKDFATLLEQASPKQQERILAELKVVDRPFLRKVLKKMVYFEELVYIDESILSEILSKVSPQLMAHAIKSVSEDLRKHLMGHLAYADMRRTMDELELLEGRKTATFEEGAQRQILKIARELEKEGKFDFELKDCPRFKHLIKHSLVK